MAFWSNWGKPWLKRNFKDYTLFYMDVNYILKHLDHADRKKVDGLEVSHFELWQNKKEKAVIKKLDDGKNPLSFKPAELTLHSFREEFRVSDGISKLRAFRRKGIKKILVLLRVGEW